MIKNCPSSVTYHLQLTSKWHKDGLAHILCEWKAFQFKWFLNSPWWIIIAVWNTGHHYLHQSKLLFFGRKLASLKWPFWQLKWMTQRGWERRGRTTPGRRDMSCSITKEPDLTYLEFIIKLKKISTFKNTLNGHLYREKKKIQAVYQKDLEAHPSSTSTLSCASFFLLWGNYCQER